MTTMLRAQGKVLALIAAMFERGGIVTTEEFGNMLGLLAAGETDPDQRDILALWAATIKDASKGIE